MIVSLLCSYMLSHISALSVRNEDIVKLAVYSNDKSIGSMFISDYVAYTKTFDVLVVNLSEEDLHMSKFCLKAYSSDMHEYTLESASESLINGIAIPGGTLRGTATFLSKSDAVHKSSIIKLISECKINKQAPGG
ncbi:DUF4354 family protein [Aeromonas salmonicida]